VAIAEAVREELGNRQGQRTDLEPTDNFPEVGETRDIASSSGKQSERPKTVTTHGAPETIDAMDAGKVAISTAAAIANLLSRENSSFLAVAITRPFTHITPPGGQNARTTLTLSLGIIRSTGEPNCAWRSALCPSSYGGTLSYEPTASIALTTASSLFQAHTTRDYP
jgi:hypothetical protein